jgi:Flp pilus assembly protein TadD
MGRRRKKKRETAQRELLPETRGGQPDGRESASAPTADPPVTPVAAWKHELPALEASGDFEAALDLVRGALLHSPADPDLLVQEIHLLGTLGWFDEADEPLRLLRLSEGPTAEVHRVGGILSFRRGRYPEAAAHLREAIESGDDSGEAHYYLGESLNRLGEVDEAVKILSRAVDLDPGESRAYSTLGRLLDRKGMREDAAVMYRKARETAP